jgi:hypothetical protein
MAFHKYLVFRGDRSLTVAALLEPRDSETKY